MADVDTTWMQQALELAERGRGFVEPNPLVGAVLVRDGEVVGAGWHEKFGGPHAEIHALNQAGPRARGGTLYVTLEPCCHHGKTPPCTEAVLRAGVARGVFALADPFPQVAGQGAERLRQAGIAVEAGLLQAEARRQNAPYLTLLSKARPHIHAKWAMTLDGKIATHTGSSQWISNEASRRRVHLLRGRMDAILVGSGTLLADDPLLTARPPGARVATRIILDRRGRTPTASKMVMTARDTPTIIAGAGSTPADKMRTLRDAGCETLVADSIADLLAELGRRRFTNLLVEGGAEILGSFADAGLIDEAHVFIAPKLVGNRHSRTPLAGRGVDQISDALAFGNSIAENLDGDIYLHAWH